MVSSINGVLPDRSINSVLIVFASNCVPVHQINALVGLGTYGANKTGGYEG
jgi:hypothetical protein